MLRSVPKTIYALPTPFASIVCAAYLAEAGLQVQVLEARGLQHGDRGADGPQPRPGRNTARAATPPNQPWLGNATVSGFNAGAFLPAHPHLVRPALEAALTAVAAGLGDTEVDVLPFAEAASAHERMESRTLDGRIVLTPSTRR